LPTGSKDPHPHFESGPNDKLGNAYSASQAVAGVPAPVVVIE